MASAARITAANAPLLIDAGGIEAVRHVVVLGTAQPLDTFGCDVVVREQQTLRRDERTGCPYPHRSQAKMIEKGVGYLDSVLTGNLLLRKRIE